MQDRPVSELGFKKRTCNILLKAGITSFSMLWFRITQGTLLDIELFGNKSYSDVVKGLVKSGYILEKKI